MTGKEYPTPLDLWKANHTDIVTATNTAESPPGYQKFTNSIYQGDKVQLRKLSKDQKLSLVSNDRNDNRMQVVKLNRLFTSESRASLGKIKVDCNADACFEETPAVVGQHSLFNMLRHGKKMPMDIALAGVSQISDLSKCDMILVSESPFTVTKECKYSVTNVTTLHINSQGQLSRYQTFQIPKFVKMQVRILKETVTPVDLGCTVKPPETGLYKLSPKTYQQLTGEPMEESYRHSYDESIDSVFTTPPDLNRRLSRLFTPPSTSMSQLRPTSPPVSLSSNFQSLPTRRQQMPFQPHEIRTSTLPARAPPPIPTVETHMISQSW